VQRVRRYDILEQLLTFWKPMQALIAQASVNAGGDALNLNPNDGDRLWFDMGVSWLTKAGDVTADVASMYIQERLWFLALLAFRFSCFSANKHCLDILFALADYCLT